MSNKYIFTEKEENLVLNRKNFFYDFMIIFASETKSCKSVKKTSHGGDPNVGQSTGEANNFSQALSQQVKEPYNRRSETETSVASNAKPCWPDLPLLIGLKTAWC